MVCDQLALALALALELELFWCFLLLQYLTQSYRSSQHVKELFGANGNSMGGQALTGEDAREVREEIKIYIQRMRSTDGLVRMKYLWRDTNNVLSL